LNTRTAGAAIEEIIREADDKVILISPYLKLSKDFKELLTYRNNKNEAPTVRFAHSAASCRVSSFIKFQLCCIFSKHLNYKDLFAASWEGIYPQKGI